jgi:1-deoxyxylulose-5-phosphate synthase
MHYTQLGRTGLSVSRLCLGTMTFGYQSDEAASFAIMDKAFDAGITFFDTADAYPLGAPPELLGATEEIVGRWLQGRRDRVILATKCFYPSGPARWDQGNSRQNIMRAVEDSLRRLQTDHIDLYQLHAPDPRTPIDESLRALDDLVRSGKVRYVGCSNFLAYQVARAVGRSEYLKVCRFDSVQPRYNLLFREIERELLPLCGEEGIGVIPFNPIAGGLLSGKHSPSAGPTEGSRFTLGNAAERYQERYWHARQFDTIEALRPIAAEAGMSLATLATAWVMANPTVTAPIIGASKAEQLDDAIKAEAVKLDPALKKQLDELTADYRQGDAGR